MQQVPIVHGLCPGPKTVIDIALKVHTVVFKTGFTVSLYELSVLSVAVPGPVETDHLCNKTTSNKATILIILYIRHLLLRPQILVQRLVLLSRFHYIFNPSL